MKKIGSVRKDVQLKQDLALLRAKKLQTAKIRQMADALIGGGYISLDEQAGVLGLSRSTTWNLIQATYTKSGLSGAVIKRMLAQSRLPHAARAKILEYVEDKSAGIYGHTPRQVRRFREALWPFCPATRPFRAKNLVVGVKRGCRTIATTPR